MTDAVTGQIGNEVFYDNTSQQISSQIGVEVFYAATGPNTLLQTSQVGIEVWHDVNPPTVLVTSMIGVEVWYPTVLPSSGFNIPMLGM